MSLHAVRNGEGQLELPPDYYEKLTQIDISGGLYGASYHGFSMYQWLRFGNVEVSLSEGAEAAFPATRSDSSGPAENFVVSPTHTSKIETFIVQRELTRLGLPFSRNIAKIDEFENPLQAWYLHMTGSYAADRDAPDLEGIGLFESSVLQNGGSLTNYAVGTRNTTDPLNVARTHRGPIIAAARNDTRILPVGISGLARVKDEQGNTLKRDKNGWGSPPVVLTIGDPISITGVEHPDIPDDHPEPVGAFLATNLRLIGRYARELREVLQAQLDLGYEIRGSALEKTH